MLTIQGTLPEEPITRWATLEEVREEVEKSRLDLNKQEARVGEDVGCRGVFTVPNIEEGDHTVRLLLDDKELATATLKVKKVEEENEYTSKDVNEMVNRDFNATEDNKDQGVRQYSDPQYTSMSDPTLLEYLKAIEPISKEKYEKRVHDCDEFSYEAMGVGNNPKFGKYGVFEVWAWWKKDNEVLGHAFNAVLKETERQAKIVAVEPQLAETFEFPEKWNLWKFEG